MEGLLSPEQIKSAKTLRAIYANSKMESLSEERRIWNEQIMRGLKEYNLEEMYILMDEAIFNQIVEVSEKHFIESK